jgi:hypothetical protein
MIIDLPKVLSPELFARLQAKAERENITIETALRRAVEIYVGYDGVKSGLSDVQQIAAYCRANLDLTARLGEEYSYRHLPLCVINAIFAVNVKYSATKNVIERFCDHIGIDNPKSFKPVNEFSIRDLIALYREHSVNYLAEVIYQNSQRTSPRSGILKAEAVLRVAELMARFGINTIEDVPKFVDDTVFEAEYKRIPGQASGVSLNYLRMIVGQENISTDNRQIIRFIAAATGREPKVDECHPLLVEVCGALSSEYPNLKPRTLDNLIWQYQSSKT